MCGEKVVPLAAAAKAAGETLAESDDLLTWLPAGPERPAGLRVASWLQTNVEAAGELAVVDAKILTPIPRPNKLLLLAGNYAKHIEEGGGIAVERARTFPYVFMKPPSTTLNRHGGDIPIPAVSPDNLDWECELGVVIGKRAKGVSEAEALGFVAGYTVVNDISDRGFRPNPRSRPANATAINFSIGNTASGTTAVAPLARALRVRNPSPIRRRFCSSSPSTARCIRTPAPRCRFSRWRR